MFFIDLILTCFSAYYDDKQGLLVTDNKQIIMQYLQNWLVVDLITSIPINLIEYYIIGRSNKIIKILMFLKLARIHRLAEFSRIGKFFSDNNKTS